MNKTISINISGLVFNIDDSAYDKLKKYLESIKAYFIAQEGGSEIIADIEARIAELFQQKLNNGKEVILLADVEEIMANLGQATQMVDEDETESAHNQSHDYSANNKTLDDEKKIYRDTDAKVIGGVCAGLSHYLGVEAFWLRIIFIIVAFFAAGMGFIIYALLWVVLPEAVTTSEKLRMKGKPVNVSNIEQSIKDSFKTISDDINDFVRNPKKGEKFKKGANEATSLVKKLFETAFTIIGILVKGLTKFLALILILVGILIVSLLFIAFFGSFSVFGLIFSDIINIVLPNIWQSALVLSSILLVFSIPLIILLIRAFQLLLKQGKIGKTALLTTCILWVIALFILVLQGINLGMQFRSNASIDHEVSLQNAQIKRLYISTFNPQNGLENEQSNGLFKWSEDEFYFENGQFIFKDVGLKVEASVDDHYHLIKRFSSKGSNYMDAQQNADKIKYEIAQNDSTITLSPFLGVVHGPYRGQNVTIVLKVPQDREIVFKNYTDDIDNYLDIVDYYSDYPNKIFKMTPKGLEYLAVSSTSNGHGGMVAFNFEGFENIDIESERNIRVEIKEGIDYKVLVSSILSNTKGFEISRAKAELKIDIDEFWAENFSDAPIHIQIECPKLSSVSVSGIGEYFIETQNAEHIVLNFAGATKGGFKGYVKKIDLNLAGVSSLSLQGTAQYFNADIAGSSKLDAFGLITEYTDIDVAGVCEVNIYTTEKLTLDASGSSSVNYKGSPKVIKDITGISTVKKID